MAVRSLFSTGASRKAIKTMTISNAIEKSIQHILVGVKFLYLNMSGIFSSGFKPVSDARFGHDITRSGWISFDFPPQVADVDPQEMGIFLIVSAFAAPDGLDQLLMGHDLPGVLDEDAQDIVFGGSQADGLPQFENVPPGQVHQQIVFLKDRLRLGMGATA